MGIDRNIELVEPCPTCGDHDCLGGLPCEMGGWGMIFRLLALVAVIICSPFIVAGFLGFLIAFGAVGVPLCIFDHFETKRRFPKDAPDMSELMKDNLSDVVKNVESNNALIAKMGAKK
jgi:Na+/melibiose symporter-like transporter